MYSKIRDTACINGLSGIYDGKIKNDYVRYARNAVDNYNNTYPFDSDKFTKTFFDENGNQIQEFPPLKFKMRYSPKKSYRPDTLAVFGVAFEELGKKISVSVKELSDMLKSAWGKPNVRISVKALDLNNDNQIDLGEYAASVIFKDMNSGSLKFGEIDNDGQKSILPYANAKNYDIAHEEFLNIYNLYSLNKAQDEFLKDANNIIP